MNGPQGGVQSFLVLAALLVCLGQIEIVIIRSPGRFYAFPQVFRRLFGLFLPQINLPDLQIGALVIRLDPNNLLELMNGVLMADRRFRLLALEEINVGQEKVGVSIVLVQGNRFPAKGGRFFHLSGAEAEFGCFRAKDTAFRIQGQSASQLFFCPGPISFFFQELGKSIMIVSFGSIRRNRPLDILIQVDGLTEGGIRKKEEGAQYGQKEKASGSNQSVLFKR